MKKLILALSVLGLTSTASAGFLVEPYLGYEMETLKGTQKGGGDLSGKGSAINLGARVGYKFGMGLWLAADPQMTMKSTFKIDDSTGDYKFARTTTWLDVGYDFPMMARLWAGYALSNEFTITSEGGGTSSDTKFKGGSSMKVGLGFRLMPTVNLSFEYLMNKYKDVESGGATAPMTDFYDKFDDNAIVVGVSFPFHFGGK